ncbi:MAG: DUF1684 domain-containing protein [Anaerolineae bacterium]
MGILSSIKKAISGKSDTPTTDKPQKRELPVSFYIDTVEMNREQKDQYFRANPYSPIAIEQRVNFTGLNYYPVDVAMRLSLPLERAAEPTPLTIRTNTGEERPFLRIGTVSFEVEGQPATLAIYRGQDHDELFVPFRDATSGGETYGAGRYLEPEELADGNILLDFNAAYNPFCAYSDDFSCPLPPAENHLNVPIRAGEMNYHN